MNYFNIVQVRIALLALFKAKEKDIVSATKFKEAILYLENFHFAYNSIATGRASRFEKIFSSFAISLKKCASKTAAHKTIDDLLIKPLDKLFPDYQTFSKRFIELTFSKKDHPNNVKTKYVIQKINSFYEKLDTFSEAGTIEHILSETKGAESLNIGNLILLEGPLNGEAGDGIYKEKKKIYLKSSYKWIRDFVEEFENWETANITSRAKKLSKFYYTEILNKSTGKKNA